MNHRELERDNHIEAVPKFSIGRTSIVISITLLLGLLFFEADRWIGAVGLRSLYVSAGALFTSILCLVAIWVGIGEIVFPKGNRIRWILIAFAFVGCAIYFASTIVLLSQIFPFYLVLAGIPPQTIIILLIFIIPLQATLSLLVGTNHLRLAKSNLIFVMILSSLYVTSMSGVQRNFNTILPARQQSHDKFYFVELKEKLASSGRDSVAFYEQAREHHQSCTGG